jgi:prepilin-type N-terminal cleavage/methylation domain-containing protein
MAAARARRDDGMTIVEVVVAMVILLVGVLGVVPMLDTGNQVTGENLARDTASALVREQLEKARELAYSTLADPGAVAGALVPAIGDSEPAVAAVFTTRRRGIPYTTTISTCVLDDPSDGIGAATGTPCRPLPPSSGGGGSVSTSGSTTTSNLNVLGIQVTGGGQLVEAVCSLFGTRGSVVDGLLGAGGALTGLVSTGADTTFCAGKGNVAFDRQADDATAVTSSVTWPQSRAARAGRVTQRVVISGPRLTT